MISELDYIGAAKLIGCEVETIKSVAAVESSGSGFLKSGEVKILFEPHIFWAQLKALGKDPAAILAKNPSLKTILYAKWRTFPYGPITEQWNRLNQALKVNETAAYSSASYGKYQIMGFNYSLCKYPTVQAFVADMKLSERTHLLAFIQFVKSKKLDQYLISKNWTEFAKRYNGSGYNQGTSSRLDDYDYKLEQVYKKLKA